MANVKSCVLVVEDDSALRQNLAEFLDGNAFEVTMAVDGVDAVEKMQEKLRAGGARFDVVVMDVSMPRMNGLECLKKLKEMDPAVVVILMTAYSNLEDAVQAVKDGAYNYLAKPIKQAALVEMIQRALEAQQMVHKMAFSAPIVKIDSGEFIGNTSEMKRIFGVIYKLAKVDTSVLIRGESGTGKELVARAIHYNSARKDKKLVAINCSSIAETLFESELFGHERGAFTGADSRQIGRFQYADGGTVFLDEIGDLSLAMQVKLLRVLQERKFTPVGANREIDMDVRLIAATNRNLEDLIAKNQFREDLFYRLNVIPIFLPPLRDRREDIGKLVSHFVTKFNLVHGKSVNGISPPAMEVLLKHHWPGNIRELENVIEHAFVIETSETIQVPSLPAHLRGGAGGATAIDEEALETGASPFDDLLLDYKTHKEQFEKDFIIKALKTFHGRINQTAMHAKIPKKTLLRKLAKYNIRAEDYKE